MSSTDVFFPPGPELASGATAWPGEQDLAPLAWVIDELRRSLEGTARALARFARERELSSEPGQAALDARALQQTLHQAGGALEMVQMRAPAQLVQAMESALLRLAQEPARCTPEAAGTLENASFALLEFLEAVLAGRAVSAVALFPQYRAVQALAGNDKVHPADLWPGERHLHEPDGHDGTAPLAYGPQARALLDAGVLALVKTGQAAAAAQLRAVCLGFAAAQAEPGARTFWKIAAGFFDALAQGRLAPDVYAKRAASRVLLQYAAMAKGDSRLPDRLTQDLLFFCAQAAVPAEQAHAQASALQSVRAAFGLARHQPVDYERARFGRVDPALQAQARMPVAAPDKAPSAPLGLATEDTHAQLRAIFLDEVQQVVARGLEALDALAGDAAQRSAQTDLRRAFHTLKGSARMAALDEFGEAGWAMEQLLNAWLDEHKPLPSAGQSLAREALQAFAAWAEAIGQGRDQAWSATPFRAAADAMRLQGQRAAVSLRPSARRRGVRATLPEAHDTDALPSPGLPGVAEEADFAACDPALQAEELRPEASDGNVKQIDGLRMPLPLYNAYLNEADEWSRCLDVALQEWARAPRRAQLAQALGWAHALAASSATVGFQDLSRLARTLGDAMVHVLPQGAGQAPQRAVFQAAANEIRRLLHQFAAGFLKTPLPSVEAALQQVLASEAPRLAGEGPACGECDAEDALRTQDLQAETGMDSAAAQPPVRVRGQLLDRLIHRSGEVLSAGARIGAHLVQARSALEELGGNLERLRQQLHDIEAQAETQTQSRRALSSDASAGFDVLEFDRFTRMQELTGTMAESVNDVATVQRHLAAAEDDLAAQGRQARALQRDLRSTRMDEFD